MSARRRSPARAPALPRASLTRRALAGAAWALAWTLAWGGALMMFAHRAQAVPLAPAVPAGAFVRKAESNGIGGTGRAPLVFTRAP